MTLSDLYEIAKDKPIGLASNSFIREQVEKVVSVPIFEPFTTIRTLLDKPWVIDESMVVLNVWWTEKGWNEFIESVDENSFAKGTEEAP